jgi:indolepyruvate ferredoxin oxidoreductase, alpha subunit
MGCVCVAIKCNRCKRSENRHYFTEILRRLILIRLITGNEAVALGALASGVKTVTGYPGTPSTGALASLLEMDLPGTYVEWSTNEKVALEIASGVAWAGHRALCTMKMSGVNVAYDSLISIAYSGNEGSLVIYVADDPGTSAGMCEQDSRGFALMTDMPMLEPSTVAETYELTKFAFELSEQTKTPVFVRLVTALANSFAEVEVEERKAPSEAEPLLIHDIARFTKAGAVVCMAQHRDLIARLEKAGEVISTQKINHLSLSSLKSGVGILASGVSSAYLDEGMDILTQYGVQREDISIFRVTAPVPFPEKEARELLEHCQTVVVLEELEPYLERSLLVLAQQMGYTGNIIGKLDGTLSRIGEYGVLQVVKATAKAFRVSIPADLLTSVLKPEELAAERPITTCAGCPHRGTYLAINQAIRKLKLKPDQVMVTGDIGCTILGMNPPYNVIWNEISMGASVSLGQGFVHAGVKTPVLATIGDSTFFHGGIPGLVNAIQHKVNLTLIIMDNRWTAMTGMQINPGTPTEMHQHEYQEVDIARIIPAMGVEHFFTIDPFDLETSTQTIQLAMNLPGVKVILSRQECAIQSVRRTHGKTTKVLKVIEDKCNLCKLCIMTTGCSALNIGEHSIVVDAKQCRVCGLCVAECNRGALVLEDVE